MSMTSEVIEGLRGPSKTLPPKFFYNETGSRLFEAITALPEYYLTRTELGIFDEHMPDIAASVGPGVCVVEYGSGSSVKIRKVLEEVHPLAYVPVDISGDHLLEMAEALAEDFPKLDIYPTCADFTGPFELPAPVAELPKVGFFPGSSIGNFDPSGALGFLNQVRITLGPGSQFIIGVDLKKETGILEAAYNDARGVTAEFNLNLLTHLSELLDIKLNPNRFKHRAIYNSEIGAIQMFLDVQESHEVTIGDASIHFEKGESVHTENSFKYDPVQFRQLAASAGFSERRIWMDENRWFAVFLLETNS